MSRRNRSHAARSTVSNPVTQSNPASPSIESMLDEVSTASPQDQYRKPQWHHQGTTIMSTKTSSSAALSHAFIHRTDEQIADEIHELVRDATRGDRRAITIIVLAYQPMLLEQARAALGTWYEQEAADVVQEFYLGLAEGRFTLPEVKGGAIGWMRRVIRSMAAEMAEEVGERGSGGGGGG